jgi:hypothetical protein
VSIFIPKVKLTCIATEIQLSYPEWIATCIQLKGLEKYLFLLNRNLTKCKGRFVLNCERRIDHFRKLVWGNYSWMHFDRLFLILRNMDYTVWDLVVRLPQQIMPFLTLCKRRINYFSKLFSWIQVAIHSGYDNCISVAIHVSFTLGIKIDTY